MNRPVGDSRNEHKKRSHEWQHYYNWDRVHGSIGTPPMDKFYELISKIPFWDEVIEKYDPEKEHIQ
jgi:transposase InsO family protein